MRAHGRRAGGSESEHSCGQATRQRMGMSTQIHLPCCRRPLWPIVTLNDIFVPVSLPQGREEVQNEEFDFGAQAAKSKWRDWFARVSHSTYRTITQLSMGEVRGFNYNFDYVLVST